jgi:hypothetical protein
MARQEYLIEYEKETIKELEDLGRIIGRSPEIYQEIRKLLGHVEEEKPKEGNLKTKKEPIRGEGLAKGESSWESYVQAILQELGGKRKKSEVVSYAKKANPKLDPELVNNAVSGKLSKLKIAGVIQADDSAVQSEGYYYYLVDDAGDPIEK